VPYSSKKKARKEDGLRLLSLALPQNIFLINSKFRRRKGDRERLSKISKQVSNILQKHDLLPPKQFQRFATLLFYVCFNIRKGEGDFLYKIIRAKKISFYSKQF
jgi:hypothetical protein